MAIEKICDLHQYGIDFYIEPVLKKSIYTLIEEKNCGSNLLDCLQSEVLSSIHASFNAGMLTDKQAELLENLFCFIN